MPDLRKGVLQQFKTFSIEFHTEIGQSSDIPARMRETRDDARPNGVANVDHHNRDRCCCLLGREGCWCRRRHEDVRLETNQLGRQLGESIIVPFRAAILNDDVLAFHVTEIAQPHA